MKCDLKPQEFGAALRDPESPNWQIAYDCLVMMINRRLRSSIKWPRVRELADAPDADLARELADEFWIVLSGKPQMLASASVQGFGAIDRQICRFLRQPTSTSIEISESRLREHLATKVREVLRRGKFIELRRSLWGVAGLPEKSADAQTIERVRANMPSIGAEWTPQRPGQDPPIARPDDIASHLSAVFQAANAYCWFLDLHRLCWDALRPPLAGVMSHERITREQPLLQVPVRDEFRDFDLLGILQRYFDSLDAETRFVVQLAYGEASTLREIERSSDISKSTAARKLDGFRSGLAEYLQHYGYSAFDESVLVRAFRDILDS